MFFSVLAFQLLVRDHPPRPKAGASSTHSMRFATFGCSFAALGHPWLSHPWLKMVFVQSEGY